MVSLFLNILPFVKTDAFLKFPKHLNSPEFLKRKTLPSGPPRRHSGCLLGPTGSLVSEGAREEIISGSTLSQEGLFSIPGLKRFGPRPPVTKMDTPQRDRLKKPPNQRTRNARKAGSRLACGLPDSSARPLPRC